MQASSSPRPFALAGLLLRRRRVQAQGWRGSGRAKGVILDPAGAPVVGATVTGRLGRERRRRAEAGEHRRQGPVDAGRPHPGQLEAQGRGRPDSNPSRTSSWSTAAAPPKRFERRSRRSLRKSSRRQAKAETLAGINTALQEGNRLAGAGQYPGARTAYERRSTQVEEAKKAGDPGRHRQHVRAGKEAGRRHQIPRAGARDRPQERDRAATDGLGAGGAGARRGGQTVPGAAARRGERSTLPPSSTSASCATTKASSTRRAPSSSAY